MKTHFWLRAEDHNNEHRSPITPTEAAVLIQAGAILTVEHSDQRAHRDADFAALGCTMVDAGTWMDAPKDTVILGLKELPVLDFPLIHRHIQFAHVFKGQAAAPQNLDRFKRGGGTLYDLEFLVDDDGRRVAAFGYWAGFAGAAIGLMAWIAQQRGETLGAVPSYPDQTTLVDELKSALGRIETRPDAIVIGALGRVGTGAGDLFSALDLVVTKWDVNETANGGPFPQIAAHNIFLNCILASPKTPLFFGKDDIAKPRRLGVIADIACDPNSTYNPIPIYGDNTRFDAPIIRVADAPALDVMAIDNLPSMLPLESSADYAAQLLPVLLDFADDNAGIWARAKAVFDTKIAEI
ncbi:UNVERIFIED_CONTAM: hypothetical protein GTU68_026547 [Idotea baltica]|nr:hypothetical protein [Idotea baltica]